MSRFGDALRKQRKAAKITGRELARKTGLSPAFLSDIELGRRWPGDDALDRINAALEGHGNPLKVFELRCKTCGQVRRD